MFSSMKDCFAQETKLFKCLQNILSTFYTHFVKSIKFFVIFLEYSNQIFMREYIRTYKDKIVKSKIFFLNVFLLLYPYNNESIF